MATILYCRVSTSEQTSAHQRTMAEATGYKFDAVLCDEGVSGVSTRLVERPEGRRLFDMLREGDTLVVRWVNRLGRNYEDITEVLREFIRRGVIVRTVINSMVFDGTTKDPMQKAARDAVIAFMAANAQAEAEAIKEAQRAGIAHAKAHGEYRGRKPSFTRQQVDKVRDMLAQNRSAIAIANTTGLSRQTVYRIKDDPAAVEAALATWERV
ncbi:recombinase [Bradyrhizobium sp. LTSPM299]|uniref:recombinase family protein n=1 Tax=Bradyrhizobium sp. LTSPM299 TaxID=1619233 RepID=UPI0005CA0619|nr:recombinase family protein [Bradyrhizobium sp. LTSPM299]KJC59377.1 recombinase [Bradyrhizobium sp. LTSPM299]